MILFSVQCCQYQLQSCIFALVCGKAIVSHIRNSQSHLICLLNQLLFSTEKSLWVGTNIHCSYLPTDRCREKISASVPCFSQNKYINKLVKHEKQKNGKKLKSLAHESEKFQSEFLQHLCVSFPQIVRTVDNIFVMLEEVCIVNLISLN